MFEEVSKDDIEQLLKGTERINKEYKNILYSKEYQMGKKVLWYVQKLKLDKLARVIKRVLGRDKKLDAFVDGSEGKVYSGKSFWSNSRIAVYTSIFGVYDNLQEPVVKPNNIDYYIITDQNIPEGSMWKVLHPEEFILEENLSNTEKNRYVKMLPHKVFADYDYSIYVDGNVLITSDLTPLIESLDSFPIAMHKHKNRDCVYEEIEACIEKGKAKKEDLLKHKALLEKNGIPRHGGLLEATVIARKHHEQECVNLMEKWWEEFKEYSKRDQISLIDILWTNDVNISKLTALGNNSFKNDLFIVLPHK